MSNKYILRSGAIDVIKRNSGTLYTREAEFLFRKVISLLKNAPAADVTPIVRCKDCKYVNFTEHRDYLRCTKHCAFSFRPNDFCSYGERREE